MKTSVAMGIVIILMLCVIGTAFGNDKSDSVRLTQSYKHFLKAYEDSSAEKPGNVMGLLNAAYNTAKGIDLELDEALSAMGPRGLKKGGKIDDLYVELLK